MVDHVHLCAGGVSVLLDLTDGRLPEILHWGAALGSLGADDAVGYASARSSTIGTGHLDVPVRHGLLPAAADGWMGRPGLSGHRDDGTAFSPHLQVASTVVTDRAGRELPPAPLVEVAGGGVRVELADPEAQLGLRLLIELTEHGVLRARAAVRNEGPTDYTLDELSVMLPLPWHAAEVLDFAGRWGKERVPQRVALQIGTHLRENRRGRTGADSAFLLHAGTRGFTADQGEVWAVHVAWSGNHRHVIDSVETGRRLIGGGELLMPGEMRLPPGEEYEGPWLYGSYGVGTDAVAARFHDFLRARPEHVSTRRPVTLNVWEAVYFDHDLATLSDLARIAGRIGVERFVLDDGWFGGRRHDRAGLGDWVVSPQVWPDGLAPLIDVVHAHGMEFGLWVEPEMVNEDSDVARAHPEWILAPNRVRRPGTSRHQQVLDLTQPAAYAHVRDQLVALLQRYDIGYLKWDHNRDLVEAGSQATGRAAVHEQTRAAYRLMDELKARVPGLEIESCSSGGARVDLEVLQHTDRVWGSDCLDPLERSSINRWTSQLVPLELIGSHVGAPRAHTTGRRHALAFRAATSLFGHLGVEWNLTEADPDELGELADWIAFYKDRRELLFTGRLVHGQTADDALTLTGVVAADGSEALYAFATLARPAASPAGVLRFPGLDGCARYLVRRVPVGTTPGGLERPAWLRDEPPGVPFSGALLVHAGLEVPPVDPESVLLISVTRL